MNIDNETYHRKYLKTSNLIIFVVNVVAAKGAWYFARQGNKTR